MKKRNIYLFAIFALASVLCLLASCKKEYIKTPFNEIDQFSVTDSLGKQLKASFSGDSIIIYWPPFQSVPTTVIPQITVSSGATISPASGTRVAFSSATIYTVTAQDGSKKNYKLIPFINQPAPVFAVQGADFIQLGSFLNLTGQYIIPDTNQTKLYLIDSSNQDIPLNLKDLGTFNAFFISVPLPIDDRIDTGYYKIKLISGKNRVVNGPYHFGPPNFPGLNSPDAGKSIIRGKTLTLTFSGPSAKYYFNSFKGLEATLYIGDNWDTVMIPVMSPSNGTLTLVLPANSPTGVLGGLEILDKNGNYLVSGLKLDPGKQITIIP